MQISPTNQLYAFTTDTLKFIVISIADSQ